jgi:hypothetical protein
LDSWVLAGAGALVFEGFFNPSEVSSDLLERLEISTEAPIGMATVLEAFEIGFEFHGEF